MANGNGNGDKKKKVKMIKVTTKKGQAKPGMGDLKGHKQLHEKALEAERHAMKIGYDRQQAANIRNNVAKGMDFNDAKRKEFLKIKKHRN